MGEKSFKRHQLVKMMEHSHECKYEGAGSFTYSFRLEQETRSKKISTVKQIKCVGCGYSLDYQ